jgi:hypothetical protein
MTEKTIDLDQRRGMAAQKATDLRRLPADREANKACPFGRMNWKLTWLRRRLRDAKPPRIRYPTPSFRDGSRASQDPRSAPLRRGTRPLGACGRWGHRRHLLRRCPRLGVAGHLQIGKDTVIRTRVDAFDDGVGGALSSSCSPRSTNRPKIGSVASSP